MSSHGVYLRLNSFEGTQLDYHIKVISSEFEKRVQRNHRYSLRAYASALGLHPSALSRILAGKQDLSPQSALDITSKLKLENDQQRLFLNSLVYSRKRKTREKLGDAIAAPELKPNFLNVEPQVHQLVSTLDAISLMELTLTSDFKNDPKWISERLNISEVRVNELINVLCEVGVLKLENDSLSKTYLHTSCVDLEKTTEARKTHQGDILSRANQALANVPFENRGHHAVTVAIDPSKLTEANRRISEFLDELCDFLEAGEKTEVYQVAIQLFPLTKINGSSNPSEPQL